VTFIAWLLVMILVGELVLIANEVRKRQKIGRERDATALVMLKEQGARQLEAMTQMNRMTQLSIERARRENAKLDEGEGWRAHE